ncbi:MAG: hypothetical protein AAFO80_19580, partial [Pseudomonadota bacterium]
MSRTLVQIIADSLEARAGARMTANQLSRAIIDDNPEWTERKRTKSKNPIIRDGGFEEIRAQVQSEIGSNFPSIEKHPHLRVTEDTPRRY